MNEKNPKGPVVKKLIAESLIHKGEYVLDLGCGEGRDSIALAEFGVNVTCIDADKQKIETVIKKSLEEGLNIKAQASDIRSFFESNRDQSYSVIIASNSFPFLNSIRETEHVIVRCIESLKPGGILYFSVFGNRDAWSGKKNMNFFTQEEIFSFVKSLDVDLYHFSIEEGYGLTMKKDIKYWHVFKFFLKKK